MAVDDSQLATVLVLGAADRDKRRVGSKIRQLRIGLGLTQAQLAGDEVTAAYVSRIESGERVPSARLLRLFAERLDVSVEALTGLRFKDLVDEAQAFRALSAERAAAATAAWLANPSPAAYGAMVEAVSAWAHGSSTEAPDRGEEGALT